MMLMHELYKVGLVHTADVSNCLRRRLEAFAQRGGAAALVEHLMALLHLPDRHRAVREAWTGHAVRQRSLLLGRHSSHELRLLPEHTGVLKTSCRPADSWYGPAVVAALIDVRAGKPTDGCASAGLRHGEGGIVYARPAPV